MTHSQSGEPVPDLQQDYTLLSSQENQTHTILRFRRRLNTCDEKFDVPITVSLSRIHDSVSYRSNNLVTWSSPQWR